MKVPFLSDEQMAGLTSIAIKILLYLCDPNQRSRSVEVAAENLGISTRSWARHIRRLVDAELITYQSTTNGFRAHVIPTRRFTWLPEYRDRRIWQVSPRACHVLLAVARCINNRTHLARARLRKIAERIGRSIRSVSLGLTELKAASILLVLRTGRSSWFSMARDDESRYDPSSFAPIPTVAHHSRLILRVLINLPEEFLDRVHTMIYSSDQGAHRFRRNIGVYSEPWNLAKFQDCVEKVLLTVALEKERRKEREARLRTRK
jgi:hypothetical protein